MHVASGREWRGGQNQVALLARELARTEPSLDQLVVTGIGTALADRLADAGIPTRLVGWRIGLSPAALTGAFLECLGEPALLHAHDGHALTLCAIAGGLTGTPFIATRRVVFPLRRPGVWMRAERIIAVSEAVRTTLVAEGIPAERVHVVHSGIDLERVSAVEPGSIRHELALPEGVPLAVSLGALDEHKDPGTILDAAARLASRLPDLHWAIAGEGPLHAALDVRLLEPSLASRVTLTGRLQASDALRLIAAADVYVTSTRAEGLGNAVLEAMAIGKPVVGVRVGGIPELLDGGAGELISPGDAEGMAASVERLLTDPVLRSGVVTGARRRVAGFSARAMAEGVRAVYRSVV